MAKIKLDLEPDPEVTVIGISSHVHDHRLCWSLNRSMGLDLRRSDTDIMDNTEGHSAEYAVFVQNVIDTEGRYMLINNHATNGILIKEHRQADFFLVVDNALVEQDTDLLQRVRRAEFVLTAFNLPFANIRLGHKLLPEFS